MFSVGLLYQSAVSLAWDMCFMEMFTQSVNNRAAAPSPAAAPLKTSAANRLIGEVVQSRRRPLLGPSPG